MFRNVQEYLVVFRMIQECFRLFRNVRKSLGVFKLQNCTVNSAQECNCMHMNIAKISDGYFNGNSIYATDMHR